MQPPAVSIVMPCFNAHGHLPLSVGSVLAQSFADWELIAVDDGSTDDTRAWLDRQRDPRIRVLGQPNAGVSAARNRGIHAAQGELLAFLDADDSWEPHFLQAMVGALRARPDAVLAYCGWQNVGLPGPRGRPFVPPELEVADKAERLFGGCQWPIHAALVRRQAVVAAGGFDAQLKNAEDYALWLEIAAERPIVLVAEVLAHYRFHGGEQASANKARAALHFMQAQTAYLATHPAFARSLGEPKLRTLTLGTLLARGFECYWSRDLPAARSIFRAVMARGYGSRADWKYMLPAWLPLPCHRWLVGRLSSGNGLRHGA